MVAVPNMPNRNLSTEPVASVTKVHEANAGIYVTIAQSDIVPTPLVLFMLCAMCNANTNTAAGITVYS